MQTDSRKRPPNSAGRGYDYGTNGYGINRRTRPASGASERRRNQRNGSDGVEYDQIGGDLTSGCLYRNRLHAKYRQVTGAGQMADSARAAGRAVFIRGGRHLAVMLMMFAHAFVRHRLRCSGFMAFALRHLHGDTCCQRTSAGQRQPQQHQQGNEFSGGAEHVRSVAKCGAIVNRRLQIQGIYRLSATTHCG